MPLATGSTTLVTVIVAVWMLMVATLTATLWQGSPMERDTPYLLWAQPLHLVHPGHQWRLGLLICVRKTVNSLNSRTNNLCSLHSTCVFVWSAYFVGNSYEVVQWMILRLYPTVPSAAVLSDTTSPSSTAITITGSVSSGTVVTGFEVRWQRDTSVGCSDKDVDTISETGPFPNSYQISGLEPGNRYTITVTVSNAAGTAPASNSVTGTTLETGEWERESVCVCIIHL